MPPVTWLWVVFTAYGQTPHAIFDQKSKVVVWLRSLEEIPYLSFYKTPIGNPFQVQQVNILELLPDYVPPGEEG
jgi:hypothetical protein